MTWKQQCLGNLRTLYSLMVSNAVPQCRGTRLLREMVDPKPACLEEGNGNPLQCSCLENPRDGGAWWAAVYGVAQSQTQLKRLSRSSSSKPRARNKQDKSGAQKDKVIEYVQGTQEPIKRALSSQPCNNLSNKIKNIVLEHSPKYKLNIHESILIEINN